MYKYNPNTYDEERIRNLGIEKETFQRYQIKYRESIEHLFKKFYDFNKINQIFSNINAPKVNDKEYNFYHKFSILENDYLFFRNNYHIEKLNKEEIKTIKAYIFDDICLPDSFIMKTANRVLFESGDIATFNYITSDNQVPAKSFVFEFAYNLNQCETLEQIKNINKTISNISEELKEIFSSKLEVPLSFVVYTANPDIYKESEVF